MLRLASRCLNLSSWRTGITNNLRLSRSMHTATAALSLKTSQDYQSLLEKHSVQFKLHTHAKATTMEEAKAVLVLDKAPYIKNLLFKLKKGGYVLVVALDSTKISKHFWKEQGIGHNNVRIAEEKDLEEILHCKRGCVNPLSLANDTAKKVVNLFVDNQLKDFEYCMFHPGDNEATLEFKRSDFENLMSLMEREIHYVDLEIEESEAKHTEEEKDVEVDENKLKITVTKAENFSEWYRQIITKAELIEYYNVSGCYILRPTSYFIWEQIQTFLDTRFKQLKVRNTYFPMFVTKEQLETEKEHVKGFAPEVAWVTKGGDSDLAQPIAIRPTSETIMYPAFAKWVRSHRDLPVLVNQWTNVVRWEFKSPTPFIRVREFLWQEGHTAHATQEEANTFALEILDRYVSCYKDLLALPVVPGRKSDNEKFAGGDITYTLENFSTTNGRSIQACTSHLLGQNFAKMFNIAFQGKDMEKHHAWQTSWGFSIRSIGAYLLTHADDKGLVLTPTIAEYQVVLIPITFKGSAEQTLEYTERIFKELTEAGIRVYLDDRSNYNPGFKINECELKGIPVRLEIGPKDIQAGEVKLVRRFDGAKKQVKAVGIAQTLEQEFKQIHQEMYARAEANLKTAQVTASNFKEFMTHLNQKKMILTFNLP